MERIEKKENDCRITFIKIERDEVMVSVYYPDGLYEDSEDFYFTKQELLNFLNNE